MFTLKGIIKKVAPLVALFFIILSIGFGGLAVYRGEQIVSLQNQLLTKKDEAIKVVIDTTEIGDAVARAYEVGKSDREVKIEYVKERANEIIKENTVFLNTCISPDGVQFFNDYVSTAYASQPSDGLQESKTSK